MAQGDHVLQEESEVEDEVADEYRIEALNG